MVSNGDQHPQPQLPPIGEDGLRHWQVAGGVVADQRGLLLVENRRRNGSTDWSTPGGVVDPGETALEALSREVAEETGLTVTGWSDPLYRVEVEAPDAGFFLSVSAFRAETFTGHLAIDDPDGIVIGAEFVDMARARHLLAETPSPWVGEPLLAHLEDGFSDGRMFRYRVEGTRGEERRITRSHDR